MTTATIELQGVLQKLEKVKETGPGEWKACCPAHEDRNPSLSVAIGEDEKILFFCHAGCSFEDITAALDLRSNGWRPSSNGASKSSGPPRQARRIVATYPYHDEQGELLFQKVRYEPKTFRLRRPDGNGGWIHNMGDVEPVLYRLPDLLNPDLAWQPIFIVEGEKDADRGASLGLLTTCNFAGAGKWREEYNRYFAGRVVYVVPDNDKPGLAHATHIANSLSGVAKAVKLVEPPGLGPGQDLSDWLDMGNTVEELRAVALKTPIWEPPTQSSTGSTAEDSDDQAPEPERIGDYGHARVLSHLLRGEYRWVRQWKSWMGYRGGRWQQVDPAELAKDGSERLRAYYGPWIAGAPGPDEFKERAKYAAQTYRFNGMTAALSFLRGWDGYITEAEEWDTDPWLLNVANGTLDLRSDELLPHDPGHLLTKQAPVVYDPRATGSRWLEHVELFLPDADIRRQVQRDLGTALVGATLEEALPIWYGLGANGKSTTARVVMSVLGDYGISAARDLLLRKKHEEHPTALADLAGRRLVFSAEADDGQRLNESLVKDLTGGDRKKARFMYGDFFEFEQTFSIVLFVNHKPVIRGTDDGIWRRVRLVPWTYQIPQSKRLAQEDVVSGLLAESPAILNWLLEGLRDWQSEPHWIAPAVRAATDEYRKEQDRLGGFVGECCEMGTYHTVTVAALYERYTGYCQTEGEDPLSKRAFGKSLRDRGLETKKGTGGVREWHGIRLQKDSGA